MATENEYISRMEAVFAEINTLSEDIKQIKSEAKDEGFKPAKLQKIAKLRADAKVQAFVQDAKELVSYIEQHNM
jgi:uncharacterized protein (UPF0335 family)